MIRYFKQKYNHWLFRKYGLYRGVRFEKIPITYKLIPLWSPSLYVKYEGELVRDWFLQGLKSCETKKASD